jgi:hypothetical protein
MSIEEEPKKCWCGKDHTNDKPVNEEEYLKEFAGEIQKEIDAEILRKLLDLSKLR